VGLLSAADAEKVGKLFQDMPRSVTLRLYTQRLNCEGCLDTERILDELAGLSDKVKLEKLNALTDTDRREADAVEFVPAFIVSGANDRVRFYGTPSGYEFSTLLTLITDAGAGIAAAGPDVDALVSALNRDLRIRVFVTPTCPHCPRAAVAAARLAAASPGIRAEIVEAEEFPELSMRYSVHGVPRTVVEDRLFFEGAVPETVFAKALTAALPFLSEEPVGSRDLLSFLEADA